MGIFQSFPQSCSLLTRLKVSGKLSEEDIPVILDDVCSNQALTHLCLREPGISDLEAIFFAKGLQTNVNLTHLTLEDRNISTVGFNALSQALHTNCVLTHLDLSGNALSDELADALSEALEINTTLTHLRLEHVILRPEHVNLFKDRIGPSGASALARGLTKNSTLKWLLLGFNCIGDFGHWHLQMLSRQILL